MQVTKQGSVRVDLVGGSLDFEPINYVLENVVTLNLATSLKAKVKVGYNESQNINIKSLDYNKEYQFALGELSLDKLNNDFYKEMTFVMMIIDSFRLTKGLDIELTSGSPPGAGLGGSSTMGIVLYNSLSELVETKKTTHEIVNAVKSIEARILNQGMPGYQDYYPALTGGVLALRPSLGKIEVEQLYTDELKSFLEGHITLVYSNISRNSGINNWQLYKDFFDQDEHVRSVLNQIAQVSFECYHMIKNRKYNEALSLIAKEGELRKKIAPGIVPEKISSLIKELQKQDPSIGFKMCGAGGGGCFILTHQNILSNPSQALIKDASMKILDFKVDQPKV